MADGDLPEVVVVPARPGESGPEMEARYSADGREVVLPVFTTVAALVARLGNTQPWVCVPLEEARRAAAAMEVTRVVINPGSNSHE